MPKEYICRKNDILHEMYFITEGVLKFLNVTINNKG